MGFYEVLLYFWDKIELSFYMENRFQLWYWSERMKVEIGVINNAYKLTRD